MVGYVARLEEGDLPALAKRERLARLMGWWLCGNWAAPKDYGPHNPSLDNSCLLPDWPDPYTNDSDFGNVMRWWDETGSGAFFFPDPDVLTWDEWKAAVCDAILELEGGEMSRRREWFLHKVCHLLDHAWKRVADPHTGQTYYECSRCGAVSKTGGGFR